MVSESPSCTARSTSVKVAKRSRRPSTCSSTSLSATSASATSTAMAETSGNAISGRMSSSAVISIGSPSLNLVRSISGWLSGWISCSCTAWLYHCGRTQLMASSSTTVRPTRWSTTAAGTLPLRNPGTVTCEPMVLYASSRLGSNSSNGTSMVSLIRVGLKVSVLLFTETLLR